MKFGKVSRMWLIISLSLNLVGCKIGGLADPPAVNLCQFNGTPRAFYCVNTVTKVHEKRALDDPRMKAAQALSVDDYRAMAAYIDYLIQQAEIRCR